MTWLTRRWTALAPDVELSAPFEARFTGLVDRSFPIDEEAIASARDRVVAAFLERPPVAPHSRVARPARRRLAVALAASTGLMAVSAMAVGAVAFGAGPGAPLYQIRLNVEAATLPSIDAPAGWQARLDRLQRRIDEGLAAGGSADAGAMDVALDEYRSELTGLAATPLDPVRSPELLAAVSRDLPIVAGLDARYPSRATDLALSEIRAVVAAIDQDPGVDHARPGDPHPVGTIGDPHEGVTTGDPHPVGTTGNPHSSVTTGNPHPVGTTANPHAGVTTGNPHPVGTTDTPHTDRATGNPHAGGSTGNPHAGGNGQAKSKAQGKTPSSTGKTPN
jgi:hypothetical protein